MRIFLCVCMVAALAAAAPAADVGGKWAGSFAQDNGDGGRVVLNLKQSGNAVSGTGGPEDGDQWPIQSGKIEGNKVTLSVKAPEVGVVYVCELTLSGDSLKGPVTITSPDGQTMKGQLDVSRAK